MVSGCWPMDPTDDDIEAMVIDALEKLPEQFRERLGSVAIVIEEEATPRRWRRSGPAACTASTRASAEDELVGPKTSQSPARSRSSAARSCARTGHRRALAAAVADTVYHEIAHHFGISDARLHKLQREGRALTAGDRAELDVEPGGGGAPASRPSRCAIAAASTRLAARACRRCSKHGRSAVLRLMNRTSAISSFDQPAAMKPRTSASRSVRPSRATAGSVPGSGAGAVAGAGKIETCRGGRACSISSASGRAPSRSGRRERVGQGRLGVVARYRGRGGSRHRRGTARRRPDTAARSPRMRPRRPVHWAASSVSSSRARLRTAEGAQRDVAVTARPAVPVDAAVRDAEDGRDPLDLRRRSRAARRRASASPASSRAARDRSAASASTRSPVAASCASAGSGSPSVAIAQALRRPPPWHATSWRGGALGDCGQDGGAIVGADGGVVRLRGPPRRPRPPTRGRRGTGRAGGAGSASGSRPCRSGGARRSRRKVGGLVPAAQCDSGLRGDGEDEASVGSLDAEGTRTLPAPAATSSESAGGRRDRGGRAVRGAERDALGTPEVLGDGHRRPAPWRRPRRPARGGRDPDPGNPDRVPRPTGESTCRATGDRRLRDRRRTANLPRASGSPARWARAGPPRSGGGAGSRRSAASTAAAAAARSPDSQRYHRWRSRRAAGPRRLGHGGSTAAMAAAEADRRPDSPARTADSAARIRTDPAIRRRPWAPTRSQSSRARR